MSGFGEGIPGITNLEHSRYHQGLVYLGLADDIHILCIYIYRYIQGDDDFTDHKWYFLKYFYRLPLWRFTDDHWGAGALPVAIPEGVARLELLLRAKPFETKMKRRCMTFVFSFLF